MSAEPINPETNVSAFLFEGQGEEVNPASELRPLPHEMAITRWEQAEPKQEPGVGERIKTIVEFDDGSRFVYQKFIPEHSISDISVDFTPPLGTRVKGFNTYLQRKLAQAGIHSRLIGANQAKGFSLLHDAQATLAILGYEDQLHADNNPTSLPHVSALIGYSMGEMKALAIAGLAPHFGRQIAFMKGLDPCIAQKVDYQLCKLPKLLPYLGKEIVQVPRMLYRDVRRNSFGHAAALGRKLLPTMGFTPDYLQSTHDNWKTIATGEAGTFIPDIPEEAAMVVHFFKQSELNDQTIFAEQLQAKPNARIQYEDGYHLSGADSEVLQNLIEQVAYGLQLVERGATPHEIADALDVPIMPATRKSLLALLAADLPNNDPAKASA
jgi:hypothetical protein